MIKKTKKIKENWFHISIKNAQQKTYVHIESYITTSNKSTDFEAEGEEVHDVVEPLGVLDVTAVDAHGVFELVRPRLAAQLQALQLQVGLRDHPLHKTVEFCKFFFSKLFKKVVFSVLYVCTNYLL